MSNFPIKKLFTGLGIIVGSFAAGGAILDSIVNALSLINWQVTIIGTILLIFIWIFLKYVLQRYPVHWGEYKIKKLGFYPICCFIGLILLLWVKPFFGFVGFEQNEDTKTIKEDSQPQLQTKNAEQSLLSNKVDLNRDNIQLEGNVKQSNNSSQETITISNKLSNSKNKFNSGKKDDATVVSSIEEKNKTITAKQQSLSKARSLISQAKYNEAINECDKILRINPSNSEAASLKNWAKKQLQILSQ